MLSVPARGATTPTTNFSRTVTNPNTEITMPASALHRVVATASVLAAVTVGLVATTDPALASNPGCGSACDDKDPAGWVPIGGHDYYRCQDTASTVEVATTGRANDYSVELRYSSQCRTAWARSGSEVYFWVERKSPHRVEDAYPDVQGDVEHTRMVNDAGYLSRACFNYPNGGTICSPWY